MTGLEPWAISVVSGVAVPVFQSLWGSGGKLFGILGRTLDEKTKDILFSAFKQYVQNYQERHGILKVLGMREPVSLESVYTAVQFLEEWDIRNFESIENLEATYRQGKNRGFQAKDKLKQEGIKVANNKQYLMVLGSPGVGKSTFLRKMGLEALKGKRGKFKHTCIPVFIELKVFTTSDITIEKVIAQEFRVCGFPEPEKFTKKALEDGKLLILLDGFDEIPVKNFNEAVTQIQNLVDQYDKNRFIASCRTAGYRSSFRRFSDVAIADFDDIQIQQFISNWFQSDTDKQVGTAHKCWELLQKQENAAAKELAHTPLLLTFLCLVYDRSQHFPNNRSSLYRRALRILLEEWAAEKRILQDEIYQGLHTELEEILLSEIASQGFEDDRIFLSQQEIVEQIKIFLANNLNAPQHLNGEAVLNAIAIQQGILVERAEDIFSFSHLTLQEYLTAYYIHENNQIKKLVTENLTNKRWQEVFLLVAGLMVRGADDLLLLMEERAQKYINTSKLQAFLHWAEQVTNDSESDIKPVGKRAIAIAVCKAVANILEINTSDAYAIADTYANDDADTYKSLDNNAKMYTDAYISAKAATYGYLDLDITVARKKAYDNTTFADAYATALRDGIPKLISDIAWAINKADRYLLYDTMDFDTVDYNIYNLVDSNKNKDTDNLEDLIKSLRNTEAEIRAYNKAEAERYVRDQEIARRNQEITLGQARRIAPSIVEAKLKGIESTQAINIALASANINIKLSSIEAITRCVERADVEAKAKANKSTEVKANEIIQARTQSLVKTNTNLIVKAIEIAHKLETLKIFQDEIFTRLFCQLKELKAQNPNSEQLAETYLTFLERIQQTWSIAFNLNSQFINLSNDEIKALEDYLYANYLILKCKQAAVRVSPITWQAIEERMLLYNT